MKTNTLIVRNRIRIKFAGIACAVTFLMIGLGCSGSHQFVAPAPIPDDRRDCPQPESVTINAYAEYFNKQVSQQVEESFDLSRQLRNLFGKGFKVAVEVVLMAADSGALSMKDDVIGIGGTAYGADVACVIKPAHSNNFYGLQIKEIIAMPREK